MEIKSKKPQIRYLNDMKSVLYDQKWAKTASNFELYFMYRGIKRKQELRYDITIIPPKMLGREFVKTKGNCNSKKFQELYTVLKGRAIFLLQKIKKQVVLDIFAIKAGKGDWVIIPPEYYVVTINSLKQELKIGNWVSEKNNNIYKELEKMKGAGYFYTTSGWVKNKTYKKIQKLRFEKPLKKMPKNLDFLKT